MPKTRSKFSPKQQRFIDYYCGNATEAALKAGYSAKTAYSIGEENLKKPEIAEAIAKRETKRTTPGIKTREERQKFWSDMMATAELDRDKLKASELLGKSEADFTDKIKIDMPPLTVNLNFGGSDDEDLPGYDFGKDEET